MWQCNYGKEPFDMRLFWLLCIRRLWVILAGALAGLALVGGIYYVKNVTLGGVIPYTMDSKYYLEYAVDPSDQQTYSYFAAYTWNDLLKSEDMVAEMLKELSVPMTEEELTASFEAQLISDLRICYIHTTNEDEEKVREIDRVAGLAITVVGERQKELLDVSLLDRGQPRLAMPDLRTLRACILGAALGAFAALFGLGFWEILEERIQVPGTLVRRYGVPVAGYVSRGGRPSGELAAQLEYLFRDKKKIGVTAVNGKLDLNSVVKLLEKLEAQGTASGKEKAGERKCLREYRAVSSLCQAPEAGEALRGQEGILLVVQADFDRGKAIEEILRQMGQLGVTVDAMVLAGADERLIRHYLWGKKKS
jgi:hypothetical protein